MGRSSLDKGVENHSRKGEQPMSLGFICSRVTPQVGLKLTVCTGAYRKQTKIPAFLELVISASSSQLGTVLFPRDTWHCLEASVASQLDWGGDDTSI